MKKFTSGSEEYTEWYHDRSVIDYLNNSVQSFCAANNVGFTTGHHQNWISESEKTLCYWTREILTDRTQWHDVNLECKKSGKIVYVVTDNLGSMQDFECVKFFFKPEILVEWTAIDTPIETVAHSKRFSCFTQRVDPVRQSWFYFLVHHQLLNSGNISFWFDQTNDPEYAGLDPKQLIEYIHYNYNLDQLPHFDSAYLEIKDHIPYKNFKGDSIEHLIAESKFSLILETYATDINSAIAVNEKTLRDIQFPSSPLLFSQQHTVFELEKHGFAFPGYMTSIDQEPAWQIRQRMLLDILLDDPEVDFHECTVRAEQNRQAMRQWMDKIYKQDYFDDVFSNIK